MRTSQGPLDRLSLLISSAPYTMREPDCEGEQAGDTTEKDGSNGAAKFASFDDVLEYVGSFGRYQKLMTFLVLLPAVLPSGFLSMSSVFFAATPADYWCALPSSNNTAFRDDAYGLAWNSARSHKKSCSIPVHPNSTASDLTEIPCEFGYEYDRSVFTETVVTEWDLICNHRFQGTFTFTAFTVGGLVGPLIWGYLADRKGRRSGFFLCIAFQSVFAILTAFSPGFIWFYLVRVLVGMTTSASYTIPFTLNLELSGPKHRAFICVLHSFAYSVGCLIFLAVAYFIRSWRTLALATAVPAAVLYVVIWKFFPESPRWLLSKNRHDQLENFMQKVAKANRRNYSQDVHEALLETEKPRSERSEKSHSPLDLVRTPNMRKKTLILIFLNICNKGISLGLNYYSPLFSPNPHLGAFLNSLVEFPPYLFAQAALNILGRRSSLFLAFSIGGTTCLIAFGINTSIPGIILTLTLIAKFCITFTYLGSKLMEDELFPTVVRSEGHSLVSVVSSVTTCGIPFIVDLGHDLTVLPLGVFGSLCVLAAVAVFFLPETVYQQLPQTVQDGEQFGKNVGLREMFWFFPRRPRTAPAVDITELETLKTQEDHNAKPA